MNRLRVGLIFGGRSGEHDVSLLSAASVLSAIDRHKYEVVLIGITKDGQWLSAGDAEHLLQSKQPNSAVNLRAGDPNATPGAVVLATGKGIIVAPEPRKKHRDDVFSSQTDDLLSRRSNKRTINVDVIFPVLHGTFGEDGTIQGLLELAEIPYVGAGVLGSAAGMDKDIMKSLFRAVGLPIVKHLTILRRHWEENRRKARAMVEGRLKYPLFVKPANLGSSVGVSKVNDRKALDPAIEAAARFDRKIVIEQGVGGKARKAREIECSVLGNDEPEASLVGEIVPGGEFYDYSAKYIDEGSELIIPAKLTKAEVRKIQQMAIAAFRAVDCSGLARVDFLMDPKSRAIYVNEINTMPGFTSISMYPKLWEASGLSYAGLIDRLIQLGIERHKDKSRNQYTA